MQTVTKELGRQRVQVQTVLEYVGFDAFYLTLNGMADLIDQCITRSVVKRFWDTTNTIHSLFGEITITAFGFVMVIGFRFIVEPLVCMEDFYTSHDQLLHLFGLIMEFIYGDHFSYSILADLMGENE